MTLFLFILAAIVIYYFFIDKERGKGSAVSSSNRKMCPNCTNPVEENFRVCPICKETLNKKCSGCGETVNAEWKYCPYCERPTKKSEE